MPVGPELPPEAVTRKLPSHVHIHTPEPRVRTVLWLKAWDSG